MNPLGSGIIPEFFDVFSSIIRRLTRDVVNCALRRDPKELSGVPNRVTNSSSGVSPLFQGVPYCGFSDILRFPGKL